MIESMEQEHSGALDRVRAVAADPDRPTERVLAALREVPAARVDVDLDERVLIETLMDRGLGWSGLAAALGARSGDALRVHYRRLGGTRTWPRGPRPATGRTARDEETTT